MADMKHRPTREWQESDLLELNLTDNGELERYELKRRNMLIAVLVSVFMIIIVALIITMILLWQF